MNKKFIKLFAASALAFFASTTLVNAKTYTSLDDLTKDVVEWKIKESELTENDINLIYIIGDYAFTSDFLSGLTDSYYFSKAMQTIPTSLDPYIFEIDANVVGDKYVWDTDNIKNIYKKSETALPETLNIQYVDMERFGDKVATNLDVNTFKEVANTHVGNSENKAIYGKYELNFDETNGKVIFTAIDPSLKISEIKNSGMIAELSRILKVDEETKEGNYTEIKITDLAEGGKTVSLKANATTENIATEVSTLLNGVTDLADLTNKKFKVELVLAEEKIPEDDNLSEFELDFVSIAKTNEYFKNNNGASIYKLSCISSEDSEKCNVVINILKSTENITAEQNGLDVLNTIIKNALNSKLVKSVNLQLGNTYKDLEYSEYKEGLVNDIRKNLAIVAKTYADLTKETFGDIIIKFNLKDGVISNYDSNVRTEEYKFEIGEYVNTDDIVDQIVIDNNKSNLGSVSSSNEYYNLSREGNKLTFNINLNATNKLQALQSVTNGLEGIIKDKIGTDNVSKVVIIDNSKESNNEYELKTSTNGSTLTEILKTILSVADANSDYVTPTMLKNLNISIRFEINATKELIPGLNNYGIYTEGSQSATYDVSFKINSFNVKTMLTSGFNNNYFSLTENDEENVYNLTVDLKDVNTSIKEANLLGNLGKYVGLFKSMSITVDEQEPVELDLSDVDAVRKTIDEVLNLADSSTLEELYSKGFTLKLVLADDVNLKQTKTFEDNTNRVTDYIVNVKLTYAKEIVANGANIQNTITPQTQVIELTPDGTYGANLTIGNNDNNVTFNDVNITGKLSIPKTGADSVKEITINGNNKTTTINGAIDIENNANVTIDGMKIVGTNKEIGVADSHTKDITNAVINVANGTGTFTLTNSSVSYSGGKDIPADGLNKDTYVYSLVYINGNAEIIGNEFDITNVKNPIEYKYGATDASDIVIKGNKFTGNNYVASDAHNVISFYGAKANSVIEVSNNEFEYANWAIRISNTTPANKVTYIITGNKVEKNLESNKNDRNPLALIGVQEINDNDLSNITIVYDKNTDTGYVDYDTTKLPYHINESLENGSALVYAYKSGNTDVADSYPTFVKYEDYLKGQNKD